MSDCACCLATQRLIAQETMQRVIITPLSGFTVAMRVNEQTPCRCGHRIIVQVRLDA